MVSGDWIQVPPPIVSFAHRANGPAEHALGFQVLSEVSDSFEATGTAPTIAT